MKAQLLYQNKSITGEAATWLTNQKKLLWVDIEGKTLFEYFYDTGIHRKHKFANMVTTIIPFNDSKTDVILALTDRLVKYNLDTEELVSVCKLPIQDRLRTNDGKASPDGVIWLGVMHLTNHDKTGSMYRIDKDLSCTKVLNEQNIPNGIVWDINSEKMYYVDSGRGIVLEYTYDFVTGQISSEREVIHIPKSLGLPDGMTIDSDGMLWIAHWGGYGVYVWNPKSGELMQKIDIPVPNVSSCTFGGPDMSTLYVTTASKGLTNKELEKYPLSGSLFKIETKSVGAMNHYPF